MQFIYSITITIIILAFSGVATAQQQRFPQPEFQTEYQLPQVSTPMPDALWHNYLDLAVLLVILSITSWLSISRRSRRGILWLTILSLLYFGFYRQGCICAVGSLQNIALSLFNPDYVLPLTALGLFMLPLLFALTFGRTFCATACPLGAIQDLVIVKHIPVPLWLRKTLGLFPFIYLGLAVLYAATATDLIICRYDPFVGIFRMSGEFHMILLGVAFLLVGMFVGRPYCRFLCPYGGLLKITSQFSKHHLSITPAGCINCKLCADSCPFDAIESPTKPMGLERTETNSRRVILLALLIPVLMAVGGWTLSQAHTTLASVNSDVHLAALLVNNPELAQTSTSIDITSFMASGQTIDQLVERAKGITHRFYIGSWVLGIFIGLTIGLMLLSQALPKRIHTDYRPNRGDCYSCGRCFKYCPVGKEMSDVTVDSGMPNGSPAK